MEQKEREMEEAILKVYKLNIYIVAYWKLNWIQKYCLEMLHRPVKDIRNTLKKINPICLSCEIRCVTWNMIINCNDTCDFFASHY